MLVKNFVFLPSAVSHNISFIASLLPNVGYFSYLFRNTGYAGSSVQSNPTHITLDETKCYPLHPVSPKFLYQAFSNLHHSHHNAFHHFHISSISSMYLASTGNIGKSNPSNSRTNHSAFDDKHHCRYAPVWSFYI